jgi:hypothetical protein
MADHAAGRSIGQGLLEDALGQGVVLIRKPGPGQEQAFRVENPLNGQADLIQGIAGSGRGLGNNCRIDNDRTLLPQPDSPTIPSTSPDPTPLPYRGAF